MEKISIKQGDAYSIPFTISADGDAVDIDDIDTVEVMIGTAARDTYPNGGVTYDSTTGQFFFPLTQAMSLAMRPDLTLPMDVRVKFANGDVIGTQTPPAVFIVDAQSRKEL